MYVVGRTLRNVCYCKFVTPPCREVSHHWGIFLNQLVQFYLKNTINLCPLTAHVMPCSPTKCQFTRCTAGWFPYALDSGTVYTVLERNICYCDLYWLPSVLWHCWLGVRKSIRPVKNWVMRSWCGYLSGARCRLFAYGPADATASQNLLRHLNPD